MHDEHRRRFQRVVAPDGSAPQSTEPAKPAEPVVPPEARALALPATNPAEPRGLFPPEAVDRLLRKIASTDMQLYVRLQRHIDLIMSRPGPNTNPVKLRARDRLIRNVMEGLNREATPEEVMYAELRYRHRVPHTQACATSGMKRIAEDHVMLIRPLALEVEKVYARLREETKVTKDDVVQGLLNAVAVAANSKDLTEAWREIGRLHGFYEETKIRIEQNVKQEVTQTVRLEGVDLRLLADGELMKHAGAELLKRIAPAQPRVLDHVESPSLPQALEGLPDEAVEVAQRFVEPRHTPPEETTG